MTTPVLLQPPIVFTRGELAALRTTLGDITYLDVLSAAFGQPAGLLYESGKQLSQPVDPSILPTPGPSTPSSPTNPTPPGLGSSVKLLLLGGGLAVVAIAGVLVYVRINKW
jgi:hypothetical protein